MSNFAVDLRNQLAAAHAEIARLTRERDEARADAVRWKADAGKYAAGCPACDETGRENEALRAAIRAFVTAWQTLPVGTHSIKAAQRWINSDAMRQGVSGLRSVIDGQSKRNENEHS